MEGVGVGKAVMVMALGGLLAYSIPDESSVCLLSDTNRMPVCGVGLIISSQGSTKTDTSFTLTLISIYLWLLDSYGHLLTRLLCPHRIQMFTVFYFKLCANSLKSEASFCYLSFNLFSSHICPVLPTSSLALLLPPLFGDVLKGNGSQ